MHVMWSDNFCDFLPVMGKFLLSGFLKPCAYVIVAIICVVVGYQIKAITAIVVYQKAFHEFHYNLQDDGHLVI